jgi:hypothetical protein
MCLIAAALRLFISRARQNLFERHNSFAGESKKATTFQRSGSASVICRLKKVCSSTAACLFAFLLSLCLSAAYTFRCIEKTRRIKSNELSYYEVAQKFVVKGKMNLTQVWSGNRKKEKIFMHYSVNGLFDRSEGKVSSIAGKYNWDLLLRLVKYSALFEFVF